MGKGDIKTRRGKIFNGSFGKTRPKNKKVVKVVEKPKAKSKKK
jgi:30S ribosomal protein S31